MSAKIMGQVYDLDLPSNEQTVLVCLADHASHDGANVYPSNGLIAWKLGMSDDTVSRMKKKLVARGILVVVKAEAGRSIEYRIDLSKGKPKAPFESRRHPPQIAEGGDSTDTAQPCGTHPPQIAGTPPAQLCGTNQKEPSGKPSKGSASASVQMNLPEVLDKPEFAEVWIEWRLYRQEKKQKLTASTEAKQLAKLATYGLEIAIRTVNHTIENGWTGLFPTDADKKIIARLEKPGKTGDTKTNTTTNPFAELTQ